MKYYTLHMNALEAEMILELLQFGLQQLEDHIYIGDDEVEMGKAQAAALQRMKTEIEQQSVSIDEAE